MKLSVIAITSLVGLSHGLQFPFMSNPNPPSHYSTLNEDDLPINLSQYQDDIVVRINYKDNGELKTSLLQQQEYKVWLKSSISTEIDIQMSTSDLDKLNSKFGKFNHEIIIKDLPQAIFETYPKDFKTSAKAESSEYSYKATEDVINDMKQNVLSDLFFKDYRPLETISAWLDVLESSFPEIIKIETIGETHEKRPYKVVHVSGQHGGGSHNDRKTIVITGGVHAREWISISTVCYQLYSMLHLYVQDPNVILNQLDFLFIPVLNPDGYEYTWNHDRLWRKNRQDTSVDHCKGVDIDHSYDYHWTHSSDWPCGEEYSGEAPFEAKEAKIWHDYLNHTNYNHQVYGYIDLHSYAQEVLFPYAYSCEQEPRDEENLMELAYGIAKNIRLVGGKFYNVLPACQDKDLDLIPDLGAGTALDFMYHEKAFWAYQIKLRDSGNHGFLLPSKYIEPVGNEIFAGIKYFCDFILNDD